MKGPSVHQFAPQVSRYDAIGNELFALQSTFRSLGFASEIYCDLADHFLLPKVRPWSRYSGNDTDVLIVHYSHGCASYEDVLSRPGRKVLIYHNVTPAAYFAETHERLCRVAQLGRSQLPEFSKRVELALAHSHFSAQELSALGFPQVDVVPYVLLEPLYSIDADQSIIRQYGTDGRTNLLVVGRIAPNKCIEDCILTFDYLKRFVDKTSRLFIVGNWQGTETYLARLRKLTAELRLHDVIFTGPVPQQALAAYYQVANGLLYMSEHEGFGVPLVEAMRYGVPVFANASTAIPETLRGAGVLFQEKSWPTIAESLDLLLSDAEFCDQVVSKQRAEAEYYSEASARSRVADLLERLDLA